MGRIQDQMIKLRCEVCKKINYFTKKNKKKLKDKMNLKKHCPFCKKHVLHNEIK